MVKHDLNSNVGKFRSHASRKMFARTHSKAEYSQVNSTCSAICVVGPVQRRCKPAAVSIVFELCSSDVFLAPDAFFIVTLIAHLFQSETIDQPSRSSRAESVVCLASCLVCAAYPAMSINLCAPAHRRRLLGCLLESQGLHLSARGYIVG